MTMTARVGPYGFDEWEKPPGCGTRILVGTPIPDMDPQQNDDEPTGPTENDWEKDTTGKRRKLA